MKRAISRFLYVTLSLTTLGIASIAWSQTMVGPKPDSAYKSLDVKSEAATSRENIRALFLEIHGRTMFGPMPKTVLDRLVKTQEAFLAGTQSPVTEQAVADAVNAMGRALDPETYTGTNALQVRLLRISFLPSLPNLLSSGSSRPASKIVSNDLSPAGATYLGLLLVRQKLANSAWFGDPDIQNKKWVSPTTRAAGRKPAAFMRDEPAEQTKFRLSLQQGFSNEGSPETRAFHAFLDHLNIKK